LVIWDTIPLKMDVYISTNPHIIIVLDFV